MSVSFNDFLNSADLLLKNKESKEIDFRNLISRSYYAMFHLSSEIAQTLQQPKENIPKGSHEKIFHVFKSHEDKTLQRLADMMFTGKEQRVIADYRINKTVTRQEAAEHYFAIKGIIQKLEKYQANL